MGLNRLAAHPLLSLHTEAQSMFQAGSGVVKSARISQAAAAGAQLQPWAKAARAVLATGGAGKGEVWGGGPGALPSRQFLANKAWTQHRTQNFVPRSRCVSVQLLIRKFWGTSSLTMHF